VAIELDIINENKIKYKLGEKAKLRKFKKYIIANVSVTL